MKILNTEQLKYFIKKRNIKKKNVILCHGVFDVLHMGHINYFNFAKKINSDKKNFLIISVTSDRYVQKGFGRPYFNHNLRMKFLSELNIVDAVILNDNNGSADILKSIKPGYYVKGPDYKNLKADKTKKIFLEKKAVEKFGGKLVFANTQKFSSSSIINNYNLIFTEDQQKIIDFLKKKSSLEDIILALRGFKKNAVTIVGEIIIDKYIFGKIIGKSSKEPYLVFKENVSEIYAGGSAGIARNLSSFAKSITVISFVGKEFNKKNILKKKLEKNINLDVFVPDKNFPTILKTRFIDQNSNYKMFGSYKIPETKIRNYSEIVRKKISKIKKTNNNLSIIVDYGHGLISEKVVKAVKDKFKFVSLNSQLNSSNSVTHNLSKYAHVDLLVVNESEFRNTLRDDQTEIRLLAKNFIKREKCKNLVITRGSKGAFMIDKKNIYNCPAFSSNSVDKVGAGDALLSVLSICLKNNLDKQLSLFLGCLAGSFSVNVIGNKNPISIKQFENFLEYAFK